MIVILEEIRRERRRQNKIWGEQNHNAVEWIAILTEEVGEAAKEAVDFHFENADKLGRDISDVQEIRIANYRKELIQVAAVAVQAVEALDRQTKNNFKPN